MIYKYLFYIDMGKVRTFCLRNGKFELMRYHGEDYMDLEENLLWQWWEETSYINKEKHEVDFCFVSDSKYDFTHLEYKVVSNTTWDLDKINEFLDKHSEYSKIELYCAGNPTPIKCSFGDKRKMFEYNSTKSLYATTSSGSLFKVEDEVKVIDDSEDSEIRRYYREKIARQRMGS